MTSRDRTFTLRELVDLVDTAPLYHTRVDGRRIALVGADFFDNMHEEHVEHVGEAAFSIEQARAMRTACTSGAQEGVALEMIADAVNIEPRYFARDDGALIALVDADMFDAMHQEHGARHSFTPEEGTPEHDWAMRFILGKDEED